MTIFNQINKNHWRTNIPNIWDYAGKGMKRWDHTQTMHESQKWNYHCKLAKSWKSNGTTWTCVILVFECQVCGLGVWDQKMLEQRPQPQGGGLYWCLSQVLFRASPEFIPSVSRAYPELIPSLFRAYSDLVLSLFATKPIQKETLFRACCPSLFRAYSNPVPSHFWICFKPCCVNHFDKIHWMLSFGKVKEHATTNRSGMFTIKRNKNKIRQGFQEK